MGQRAVGRAYCRVRGYVNYPELQPPQDPILSPAAQYADVPGVIAPGKDVTCIFGMKAVRTGTVWLEGGYGGIVYVSDYERDIGEKSPLLEIHVGPANP